MSIFICLIYTSAENCIPSENYTENSVISKEFKGHERLRSEIQGIRITPSSFQSGLRAVEFEDH